MGPAGNQSPRHVTKANTFEEAGRLGKILGEAVEKVIGQIQFEDDIELAAKVELIDELPRRTFPDVDQAREKLRKAVSKLEQLRSSGASKQDVRTAECDWFGAEETLVLAEAAKNDILEKAYQSCLPAEIQVIKIGKWNYVGWQGEIFVEYALSVKEKADDTFVISLAGGELQGYIVTKEAAEAGGYEASNALFGYKSGDKFVDRTIRILNELK
jgi:hypothetical protein